MHDAKFLTPTSASFRSLALLLTLFADIAYANLLTNGSFESPAVPGGSFQQFNSGSAGIPGWTVIGPAGKGVAIVSGTFVSNGTKFPAQDGAQWVNLAGYQSEDIEGISQSVPTTAGATYTLTFWVGNVYNYGPFGPDSSVCLKINGVPVQNFTNSMASKTTLSWQKFAYSFIATSATTAIEFDNLDPTSDYSNALDNVDLEPGGTAAPAPTNLMVNGDFESPIVPTGVYTSFNSGSTGIPGWTVTGTTASNTVAVVSGALVDHGFLLPSENGHQYMDLTGTGVSNGTRGIQQTVSTTAGATYRLTFWVGNVYDPQGDLGTTSTVGLKINGSNAGSFENSSPLQSWQQFVTTFTATASTTTIEFDNLDPPTDTANALDNIVLQSIASAPLSVTTVISAGAFGGFPLVSPGSWIEIYGSNLASDTRSWAGSDFNGVNAPMSLGGTTVTIGGQNAFIDYISPTQVNAQVASTVAPGLQPLVVTTSAGSAPYTIFVNPTQPGLLAPSSFSINGTQYVVALFSDGTYVLPPGAISGVNSRPAKPGDTIVLYGVGFGPVIPDTPAGQIVEASNTLASGFTLSIGGQPATLTYSGLVPNYVGLYQFNAVVPDVGTGKAVPLTFTLGDVASAQPLSIAIGN